MHSELYTKVQWVSFEMLEDYTEAVRRTIRTIDVEYVKFDNIDSALNAKLSVISSLKPFKRKRKYRRGIVGVQDCVIQ